MAQAAPSARGALPLTPQAGTAPLTSNTTLQLLVNNAGAMEQPFGEVPASDLADMFALNAAGALQAPALARGPCTQAVAAALPPAPSRQRKCRAPS